MTATLGLCSMSTLRRLSDLATGITLTLDRGTRRRLRAVVPNCARLRHTRPVAFTRRLVTCARVFLESGSHLSSTGRQILRCVPLNDTTLTAAALPLSHTFATRTLKFGSFSQGDLSNMSSHSRSLRVLTSLSVVVIRVSHLTRRIVV